MSSDVEISNKALQKLGQGSITALDEDSVAANECNRIYTMTRDSELRAHPWNFAVARASLAADTDTPEGEDFEYQYALPTDCLRLLPKGTDNMLDWTVEGRMILTNDAAPLYIRYISRVEDPEQFDSAFVEAFATKLAFEMCEKLTQSNSKKAALKDDYKDAIREAKRVNAFENTAQETPEDTWITARL